MLRIQLRQFGTNQSRRRQAPTEPTVFHPAQEMSKRTNPTAAGMSHTQTDDDHDVTLMSLIHEEVKGRSELHSSDQCLKDEVDVCPLLQRNSIHLPSFYSFHSLSGASASTRKHQTHHQTTQDQKMREMKRKGRNYQ